MDTLWWIIIIASFVVSYIGLLYPVLPSPLFLWIGLLTYQFLINSEELSLWFWLTIIVLTGILIVSDIFINSKMVKKYGGSKWGERMAGIGVILGSFVFPPFGVIIVPFILVLVTELVQKEDMNHALKSSFGALMGFLGGTVAKFIIQTVIIVWFFLSSFVW